MSKVPLERYLRQLTLDLLGRPPTYEEYRAAQARGEVTVEDVRALMEQEAFYARLREYHRALLWSNVSASVYNNRNTRLYGSGAAGAPLSLRGNSSRALRGANNQSCNGHIAQDACNAWREDPHAEPAGEKACYDERGVPLPVSWDYDTSYYRCERLDQNPANASITSCEEAESQGRIDAKYRYFCDMRRLSDGSLVPHLCLPDPGRSTTGVLTQEELDGSGRVVAFAHPNPTSST
ncbi:MAG TPA: DUF1585 domain-containing protein, partial [Myxococcaceae bacterium]|nr:DUF1585 domain-containing protein [Myxococcaceae bacterium]